ncbi:MAG: tRNA lysidine(34) synthetase TilS [Candidatus Pelagibacter sp.]
MKKKNLSAKKIIHNFYFKKLDDPRIKRIYLNFKKKISSHVPNSFCVAVSGGADSMALSFLAKCYSLENNKKVYFFIVDHKLRKNSTSEANLVKKKLKLFQISSNILSIQKINKKINLQSFARANRYKLIINQSLTKKIDMILTAHHTDDLIENFFIRLLRGSGLKGLISFNKIKSKVTLDDKIFILRPLLDVSKKDLIYLSKNTFNFNVNDPSNLDDKFLRVKVRKLISNLEKEGLTFNKFKLSLNNLNKSNNAIDHYVQKNINDNSSYLKFTNSIILKDDFLKQPDEIVFRSFSELIQKIGKKDTFARGAKVLNLLKHLQSNNNYSKKTLSGCIIQKIENSVIISSEKR